MLYDHAKIFVIFTTRLYDKLTTRLYDKRDDFNFPIVNFPFLIPSAQHTAFAFHS